LAVKTITITEEAYRKLARSRRRTESFPQALNRILGGPSAREFVGVLTPDAADSLDEEVHRTRRSLDHRVRRTSDAVRR
jgi:predicted CopG family antitoxin